MTQIKYIGLDIETTGLDPRDGSAMIEVGMIAYDKNLTELDSWSSLVYSTESDYHRHTDMDPYVADMHAKSGLWDELDAADHANLHPDTVEEAALQWLDSINAPRGLFMLGSSVSFDRSFLAEEMPRLLAFFSHRSLDATSVMEAAAIVGADSGEIRRLTAAKRAHRVLDDIRVSAARIRASINAITVSSHVPGTMPLVSETPQENSKGLFQQIPSTFGKQD